MKHLLLYTIFFLFSLYGQGRAQGVENTEDKEELRQVLPTSDFTIRIEDMEPLNFPSRTVSYGYSLTLHNDTVTMYLPYMGEVYQPEFTNDGLDMTRPIYDFATAPGKKGCQNITFRCRRDFVEYRFAITLYPGGKAYIHLMPSNAQSISYSGELEETDDAIGQVRNVALEMTERLGFGWNLGNHFDSHNNGNPVPESWGSWWDKATPTEALYTALAKAGVKTVRIPVTWGPWQGEAPQYLIDKDYLALVRQNVLWAKKAGLNVILNTHHDEYWLDAYAASLNDSVNQSIKLRIEATWRQIAKAFKHEGEYLILETFNELNHHWANATQGELAIMNEWNQLAVDVIRSSGGKNATRWIAVPSYQASPLYALSNDFRLPDDRIRKLIVAVHCYDPYDFTIHAVNNHDAHSDLYRTTWGTEADRQGLIQLFDKLRAKFVNKGIPCYLGEFGCSMHKSKEANRCRQSYLSFFCQAAHQAGLAACIWDNFNPGAGAEHHSYFSHNDGTIMEQQDSLLTKMILEYE